MSGPKVVVIYNPEQLRQMQLVEKRRLLAQLDNTIAALNKVLQDSANLQQSNARSIADRKAVIEDAFEQDHTKAVRIAQREIDFLNTEIERIREGAAETVAAHHRRKRMLSKTATAFLQRPDCTEEQRKQLQSLIRNLKPANEDALENLSKQLDGIVVQSMVRKTDRPDTADHEFSARLKSELPTVEEPGADIDEEELITQRLEHFTHRVHQLSPAVARQIEIRLEDIQLEQTPINRKLKLESLMVEVSNHFRNLRTQEKHSASLDLLLAELQACETQGSVSEDLRLAGGNKQARMRQGDPDPGSAYTELKLKVEQKKKQGCSNADLQELQKEVAEFVDCRARQSAELHKRSTILSALQTLGYETREGMSAATVKDGSLVIRKPGSLDYGLQINAPANSDKMQFRVVSFRPEASQQQSDHQSDKQAEDAWCQELAALKTELEKQGYNLSIAAAVDAGVTPIRHCALAGTNFEEEEEEIEYRKKDAKYLN